MTLRPIVFLLCATLSFASFAQKGKKNGDGAQSDLQYKHNFHEGLRYKLTGKYQLASDHLLEALKYKPEAGAAHYALSEILTSAGKEALAFEHASMAVKADPENTWYLRMLGTLQRQLPGKMEDALGTFEKLAELAPKDLQVKEYLIDIALRLGENKKALQALKDMQLIIGYSPQLALEMYRLQMIGGKELEAQATLEEALESDPGNLALIGTLIEHFNQQGRPEMAKIWLEKALENDPGNGTLRLSLAELSLKDGERPEDYLSHLKLAFEDPNLDPSTKVGLVIDNFFSKSSQTPEQVKAAKELAIIISQVHPDEARAYSLLGDIYSMEGQNKESLDAFRKALILDKSKLPLWTATLSLEYAMKAYDSLRVHGLEATETFPTQPLMHLYAAIGEMETGDPESAADMLEAGYALVINDPQIQVEFLQVMARNSFKTKDYTDGKSFFDEALTLSGNHPMIMNNYAYQLAEHDHDLKKAEKLIKEALDKQPDEPTMEDTYGWVLYKRGKYDEAASWVRKAIAKGSASGEVYEHLGDILIKSGNRKEAIENWEKAKTFGGHSPMLDQKLKEAHP